MAVTVKTGGTFTKEPGQQPGLYVRFIKAAIAAITVGARSKVATIKSNFEGGTAEEGKIYRVTDMDTAYELFGEENAEDIKNIMIGGASEVVVGTFAAETGPDYTKALQKLETYEFHVFVAEPGTPDDYDSEIALWLKQSKADGRSFVVVYANATAEGDVAAIKTKAQVLKDEYAVFVANGVKDGNGTEIDAEMYATYVAGKIAGAELNASITFSDVPFSDVITRFRNIEVKELLAAGIVVTVMDGDQPKIKQGLTLGDESLMEFKKIRTVRAKQALIDDISTAVNESYIGKITNSEDGQIAVLNAIKVYLETLTSNNIVAPDFAVELDKTQASIGDEMYVNVTVRFLDSIEYIYLTVIV